MTIQQYLDLDIVDLGANSRLRKAVEGWQKGALTTEEPFINRIIEQFNHSRWRSDIGTKRKVVVKTKLSVLHRKGEHSKDKYGADLAITVIVENIKFLKTALFQVKVANELKATVEKKQIVDALASDLTKDRSFVLAIDRSRGTVRLAVAKDLLPDLTNVEESKTFDVADWLPFTAWLSAWLKCEKGLPSRWKDKDSIESLLSQFVVEPPSADEVPWITTGFPVPAEFTPPKHWLKFFCVEP